MCPANETLPLTRALAVLMLLFLVFNLSRMLCGGQDCGGFRIFQDDNDRGSYALRGLWAQERTVPYRDSLQEYPPVAPALFALPYRIVAVAGLEEYMAVFSLLMYLVLIGLVLVVSGLLSVSGLSQTRLYLLLLPAFVYFSLNRFDVLAAFFAGAALLSLARLRLISAFFLLGVAGLTKVYPLLYVPLFFSYACGQGVSLKKLIIRSCAGIILSGAVVFFLLPAGSFLSAAGQVASFHFSRLGNAEGCFSVFEGLCAGNQGVLNALKMLSVVLMVSLPVILALRRIRSFERLVIALALATLFAVHLFWFHSPQWLVWVVPLLVLVRDRWTVALVLCYDLLTYIYFPLAGTLSWRLTNGPLLLQGVLVLHALLRTAMVIWLARLYLSRRTP